LSGTCRSVAGFILDQLMNVQVVGPASTGCEAYALLRIPSQ
jgi:ABC-type enterochelin transport system permease subunit